MDTAVKASKGRSSRRKGPSAADARPTAASALRVSESRPLPLGVHDCCDGFNFALFSRHATRVELILFEDAESATPFATVDLAPERHKSGDIWHVLVDGVRFGQAYAYRVQGRFAPEEGLRYDAGKLLLDPYALAVCGTRHRDFGRLARTSHESLPEAASAGTAPKCVLAPRRFDWQGVSRPKTSWSDAVIYEMHVRGLTAHPSARVTLPGTFLAVVDKIPYLRELGVTAVELMPVQEFNENELLRADPAIRRLRIRQMKNLLATLLLSRGVPMILGGDEFARSQNGNNNAYCQDNEVSWYDWRLADDNAELLRFAREAIAFRKRHAVLREERFYRPDEIRWIGAGGVAPDWNGPSRALGCVITGSPDAPALCLSFNADTAEAAFLLPSPAGGRAWRIAMDTAADPPGDVAQPGQEREIPLETACVVPPRGAMVLLARDARSDGSAPVRATRKLA